jgi:hypothetical protein
MSNSNVPSTPAVPERKSGGHFWRNVWAFIVAASVVVAFFFGGFVLGDRWSGVKWRDLSKTIEQQNTVINQLNDRINLLTKGQPEFQSLLDQLKNEKLVVISTGLEKEAYTKIGNMSFVRDQLSSFQDALFLNYGGAVKEQDGSESFQVTVSGLTTHGKTVRMKIGYSFAALVKGVKYVFLLTEHVSSLGEDNLIMDIYKAK